MTGKRRDMGLGTYPEVGISEAREAGTAARKTIARRRDPIEERQAEKAANAELVGEVELTGGTKLTERVSAVRGTPRNPMSRAEVVYKARDLTAPVLGREAADRLIETVLAIEAVADVGQLRQLLQRG
jgi:2-methylcitrate dehydratase PrpD